jgi:sensor c-di-GMP phosphodiesterase-like protein
MTDATPTIDEMRSGLEGGEFFLEYLPIIALADGDCIGAEALIRWRRPMGVLSPMVFMPLAEKTPLSGLITYWVVDTVALELGDWLMANRDACVAINVPPELLGRGGVEYVARKSRLMEVAPQVIVELTERGIPDEIGLEVFNTLKERRIRVALDDLTLASGANLAVLARLQFDIIKLDKSLIDQIGPALPVPDWLQGLTALLRFSPFQVIAEGVETKQQAKAVRDSGIQYAQGFLFSRPLPAAAFVGYHQAQVGRPDQSLRLDPQ